MYRNPYESTLQGDGKWRKANFHLHAGTSTDPYDIGEVVSMYKKAGYEILTVSNQYVLTDTTEYAERYGIDMINGIEYMEQEEMLCIGLKDFISGGVESAAGQCAAQGGFSVACHPNYLHRGWWPPEKMAAIAGIVGLEVMNPVIFKLQGSGLASDCWDEVLTLGRLIWGFGSDDFHTWQDFARAWTMIYSASAQLPDIKEAVLRGSLYASTGLMLGCAVLEGETFRVSVDCGKADFGEITLSFMGEGGTILSKQTGTSGVYSLSGNEKYVRVHAMAESGHQLWTQPIFEEQRFAAL